MLIDSHAHLDSPDFREDLPAVLERAQANGVGCILTICCLTEDTSSPQTVLDLLESQSSVFATVGVHPHDASLYGDAVESLMRDLLSHPKIIGVGEIGLDFHYENSPRPRQEFAFRRQIRIALKAGKPIVIHTRAAESETCDILEEEVGQGLSEPGVLHCFSGGREMAQRAVASGFLLAFGGILTFPKAETLRGICREIPEERLLIETDCPYLAPLPYRGKRNEPAFVRIVAEKMAEVRGTTLEGVAGFTTRNFRRLFRLESLPG